MGSPWRLMLVVAGGVLLISYGVTRLATHQANKLRTPPAVSTQAVQEGFSRLADRARPALVSISVQGREADSFWERFRRQLLLEEEEGDRPISGFLVRADGCIVTSAPALGRPRRIRVTLADGRVLPARLLDQDVRRGLAVLKVNAPKPLPALPLGNAAGLRPGAMVLAAGSPYALTQSFSQGVISAVGRELEGDRAGELGRQKLLQTDAAVNQGSGGGPLIDVRGRVVGVTVGLLSPTGTNAGVGFAIPLDGRNLGFVARALRKA